MNYLNKVILVTGGTGSFGGVFIRHLLSKPVKSVICLSRDEKKQSDLRRAIDDDRLSFVIADIRDASSVDHIFFQFGIELVIHCAAMKQVPACEKFPNQAFLTNVVGSNNIKNACLRFGVNKLVLLSTDKAVHPVNTMGMTKALAEKVLVGDDVLLQDELQVVITRYGNVLSSRGSVIPMFIPMIKAGRSLPITDVRMTRFLMSLEESTQLVDEAISNGKNGEILVRKQPSSDIMTLAESLGRLLNVQIQFHICGIRPGEKLNEQLVSDEEMFHLTDHDRFFKINASRLSQLPQTKEIQDGTAELVRSDTATRLSGKELDKFLAERLPKNYFSD